MHFPRALREAIPDLPTFSGRVLELDSISGEPLVSEVFGRRVQLRMLVQETGKLTGRFVVLMDLQPVAARTLAGILQQLADEAESQE